MRTGVYERCRPCSQLATTSLTALPLGLSGNGGQSLAGNGQRQFRSRLRPGESSRPGSASDLIRSLLVKMNSIVEQIRSRIEFINRAWKSGHISRDRFEN